MDRTYQLRRDRHAISEFTATATLFQPVGPVALASAHARLKALANRLELPAPFQQQLIQINLAGATPPNQPLMSLGFHRFNPAGEAVVSLASSANDIVMTVRDYQGWDFELPRLVDAFSDLMTAYLTEVPALRSIQLQYLNEFRAKKPGDRDCAELFREGTKFVAPFYRGHTEAWHCHVGEFRPVASSQRNLVNINCDVMQARFPELEQPHNFARVTIVSACHFDIEDQPPLVLTPMSVASSFERYFNEAHDLEKSLLAELFSDSYLEAMGAISD